MLRVEFFQPAELREALEVKAAHPEAVAIAGGTDLLVDMNFDRRHPEVVLDLGRVPELRGLGSGGWGPAGRDSAGRDPEGRGPPDGGWIRLTAGTTFHELTAGLGTALPALAIASRTVGSPQIRHRATIGGNLATASPAGYAHPPLLATGAEVEVCSVTGTRRIPIDDFFIGPKRSALAAEELIVAVHVPAATGPQQFAKVGTRNAMVIAVCSFALALHPADRRGGAGGGSARPGAVGGAGGVGGPAGRRHRAAIRRARVAGSPPDRRRPWHVCLPPSRPRRAGQPDLAVDLGGLPAERTTR